MKEELTRAQRCTTRQKVDQRLNDRSLAEEMLAQISYFGGAMALKYTHPSRSVRDLMLDQEAEEYFCALRRERQALMRLKKRKLVEIEKSGRDLEAVLTQSGHVAVLRQKIHDCKAPLPVGEHCIVAFDIAQHARDQRDQFRSFLKQAGFTMLQMSVWSTVFDEYTLSAGSCLDKILTPVRKVFRYQMN